MLMTDQMERATAKGNEGEMKDETLFRHNQAEFESLGLYQVDNDSLSSFHSSTFSYLLDR